MIDNETTPDPLADPVMIGHEVTGTWPIPLAGHDLADPDPAARVQAWRATFADGDGARVVPVVRLAVAGTIVDGDGALTMSADDAVTLAAHLDHSAGVAHRAVIGQ